MVQYPSLTEIGPFLDDLVKNYPEELKDSKVEALQLVKAPEEIRGSAVAILKLGPLSQIILLVPSLHIRFVGQVDPGRWAPEADTEVLGMYYFDGFERARNPYQFRICLTPTDILLTFSKDGQAIPCFLVGPGASTPTIAKIDGTGGFVPA
ncbi:hypothetical protein BOTBODRAFT_34347 [Botryobasidium botryosum FD-172 SS1]|uniref:Uncharacterized protein n=1 Tax=Botryobasidium botryosum (strain FD-172 SS1) TaxID=930990 RepID=A0A067MM13_BOTB1|nr:hypothetical protein BOTBODRAFT_34347 [Botryobasidium botryosum FD-172 SS1]